MKLTLRSVFPLYALLAMSACGDDPPATAQFISPVFGDQCAHDNCSGQGTCMAGDVQTGPVCQCDAGYTGARCERCSMGFHRDAQQHCVPDRLCKDQDPNPCGTHGTCSDGDGVIFCACDTGYEGPRCTLCGAGYAPDTHDECLQKVLANGRTVTIPAACQVNACNNHGQCHELDTSIECDCYPGYAGGHCEQCGMGYRRPAGIDRCEPSSGCQAPACGGCVVFDGARSFPNHPDTCNSSRTLVLDDITLSSTGGEGTLWLCAQSSRYDLPSEHVAVEAGMAQPARIEFSKPIKRVTLDYVPWESFDLEVLGDGHSVLHQNVERYAKSSLDATFDPPIRVLSIRSDDVFAHSMALDNLVYESAPDQCP
jgi:hypothetical protein